MSANLPKVLTLLVEANIKWFDLGLQLGVKENALKAVEQDHTKDGVDVCLREMLSLWLKMINPQPSWEGLVAALEKPSVRLLELARKIREEFCVCEEADQDSATPSSDGTGE